MFIINTQVCIVTFNSLSLHIDKSRENHINCPALTPSEHSDMVEQVCLEKSVKSSLNQNWDVLWCVHVFVEPVYPPLCGVNTPREKNPFSINNK